jgi:predicted nucleic acid-binding protein
VTASEVLLDSTAWWEIVAGTKVGKRLSDKYLASDRYRVHTSALTIGELVAKSFLLDPTGDVAPLVRVVKGMSDIHNVTADIAEAGGYTRAALRRRDPDASLADGIILATARALDAKLVTNDRALVGERDVIGF